MKQNINRIFLIILPICLLLCFFLWLLKTPPESVTVEAQNGVWDLRGVDFNRTSAKLIGQPEYVLNALLTPDEFAASKDVQTEAVPDGTRFLTFRFRILLPDSNIVALARYAAGNASRIYVNGRLLGSVGTPGETGEATISSNRYISFTAWPENSELEIVEQTANFVHKDEFEPTLRFYVGSERAITDWTTRFHAFPVIEIGIYLLLFIIHLLLFLTLPSYRANLWLALLCLAWALKTGVIGTKLWLTLLPLLTWETAFRIEYLAFPVSLLLLSLTYRELFPGAQQKGFRLLAYIVSPLTATFILLTNTKLLSYTGVPMIALGVVASAYVLVRILYTIRKPGAEQKLVLSGLGVLVLALVADTLYFNTATSGSVPGSMMETALILFSLLQMTALLHVTMKETAAAKQTEQYLAAENAAQARMIRLKNDMVATITHELRTPLTVMSSYVQYAIKSIKNGDYTNESIQRLNLIPKEANRLADLSSTLLDVFKDLDSRRQKESLSVSELISHTAGVFKPIMERKRNIQEIHIGSELPSVFGNDDELTQVLFNLLTNADTHTKNGKVSIAAESDGNFVIVTIIDTGDGISSELLPHVFEKHIHDENGAGYGLTICKEIIEEHGGEISVKSSQGEGTAVTFTLPVWRDKADA